jgi:peroxiredoxin
MNQEIPPTDRRKGPVRRLLAAPLIVLGLAALVYLTTRPLGGGPQPSFYVIGSAVPGMQVGQIAPGSAQAPDGSRLALTGLDGAPVTLADYSGRSIWLIFWKTACQPCEAEATDVAASAAAHQKDGLVVLGVDLWDTAAALRDYTASHTLSFPIAVDPTGSFMQAYGVWGAPTHYFIDSAGIIKDRYFGPMTRDLIEESLRKVI